MVKLSNVQSKFPNHDNIVFFFLKKRLHDKLYKIRLVKVLSIHNENMYNKAY
jgi:hypothetical protein